MKRTVAAVAVLVLLACSEVPDPPPSPTPTSVFYADCEEVKAAGKAPLSTDDPGYRIGLDRDRDGVACDD